jgi:hypothetical protein
MAPVRKKSTGKEPQVQPDHPAFPARWCYGLSRALPGEPGFLAPVIGETSFRQLDTSVGAPGPHAFAVRVHGARLRRDRVHRNPPHVR